MSLGIDLRSKVARDVRVGNRDAVDKPTHLVPTANVKLVMREIRTWNIIRNHGQTIGTKLRV
jgi:hypothetical protein